MLIYNSFWKHVHSLVWGIVSLYHLLKPNILEDFEQLFESNQVVTLLYNYFSYEGGRIQQKGDGEIVCAVSVEKAQDSDNGKWTCQISTLDVNNNADGGFADVNVIIRGNCIYTLNMFYLCFVISIQNCCNHFIFLEFFSQTNVAVLGSL